MRQQKTDAGSGNKQMLTIQDTRMEIIKGDIIQSTAELEFLTRKICQNHQKGKNGNRLRRPEHYYEKESANQDHTCFIWCGCGCSCQLSVASGAI